MALNATQEQKPNHLLNIKPIGENNAILHVGSFKFTFVTKNGFDISQHNMKIYLFRNSQRMGPYSIGDIQGMVTADLISGADLAWHEGLTEWQPLSTIISLSTQSVQPPDPVNVQPEPEADRSLNTPPVEPHRKPLVITQSVVGGVVLLWAIIATVIAVSQVQQLRNTRQQLNDIKQNITKLEEEAKATVVEAKKQAVTLIDNAEKIKMDVEAMKVDVEGMNLRNQGELGQVFKNLRRYSSGRNQVNQQYVASFSVSEKSAKITLTNGSSESVSPKVQIRLINRFGFITDTIGVHWLLDTIKPGETKIEENPVTLHFGEPVYYEVIFGS